MKRALVLIAAVVVVLTGLGFTRVLLFRPAGRPANPAAEVTVPEGAAERLAGSIRIPTISHEKSPR